jgi:hypothetical protein
VFVYTVSLQSSFVTVGYEDKENEARTTNLLGLHIEGNLKWQHMLSIVLPLN